MKSDIDIDRISAIDICENPTLAYKLIKQYKIKLSDIGISDRMLRYLKNSERKLSFEKARILLDIIRLKTHSLSWIEHRPPEPEIHGLNDEAVESVIGTINVSGSYPLSSTDVEFASSSLNPFAVLDLEKEIEGFIAYVKHKYRNKRTAQDYLYYAKYLTLLRDPMMLAISLFRMSEGLRRHVIKCISVFCKYLDIKYTDKNYTEFFRLFRYRTGLKWEKGEPIKTLADLAENYIDIYRRLLDRSKSIDYIYHLFYRFMLESGLRTSEAIEAFNNFKSLYRVFDSVHVIELMQMRKTKRVYFAFITPSLAEKMNRISTTVYAKKVRLIWKKICFLENLDHRRYQLYGFRKVHATILRRYMDRELVDLLQGRAPKTIFDKHYNVESLKHLYAMYIRAFQELIGVD